VRAVVCFLLFKTNIESKSGITSGRIFREQSGKFLGTFGEHSVNMWETGNVTDGKCFPQQRGIIFNGTLSSVSFPTAYWALTCSTEWKDLFAHILASALNTIVYRNRAHECYHAGGQKLFTSLPPHLLAVLYLKKTALTSAKPLKHDSSPLKKTLLKTSQKYYYN
jgi:hypothetical protein